MKRRAPLLCLLSLLLFLPTVVAADLQFEGVPTFSVAKSKVNLVIPKIVNKSTTTSGAIFVQVWATVPPYTGVGNFPGGYILAVKTFAPLKPNASYNNIVASLPFKVPGDGTFHTLIAIHETKALSAPVDFVNSPGTFTFSNQSQISMEGNAAWTLTSNGAVIKMNVARITNNAYSGRSGTLRLEVWATPAPYEGGVPQNGFMLGQALLSPLSGGYSLENISKVSGLKSPPGGFYYTTLIVTEYTRTGFVPRDFIALPDTFYFGGPKANAPKLDIQETAAWAVLGKTVKITIGKIFNPRNGSVSGALKVNLYSTPSPYTGGPLPAEAQLLGTANFGTVKGAVTNKNLTRTVAFTQPTIQTNYTALVLTETISPAVPPVEQDYFAFGSQVIFTNKQLIGLTEGHAMLLTAHVNFVGKASYSIVKDSVNLNVEKISNNKFLHPDNVTGPILLRMWAVSVNTNSPSYTLFDRYLGRLQKGAAFTGISGPNPYTKPPPGKYRPAIAIYEQHSIVDDHGVVTNVAWSSEDQYFFNSYLTVR